MTYKEAIMVLSKRATWLEQRIRSSDKELTHDKKELAALEIAMDLMQDFTDCDGVVV